MTGPGRGRRFIVEIPATLAALATACIVEVGLRATSLPRLANALGSPLALADVQQSAEAPRRAALSPGAKRRVSATRRVLRHWPFGDTCLRQALISGALLRGLRPQLHVGVAKIDDEIRAHAWLEIRGAVLDPRFAASSYQTLATPGGRSS